jgi:hypothetical protein
LQIAVFAWLPPPADAAPAAPPFGSSIDAYAAWDEEDTCSRWEKPGVVALKKLVLQAYPTTVDWNYVRACDAGNPSGHQQGTAWDWGIMRNGQPQTAVVNDFLNWLLATRDGQADAMARRLGIMYIIWNRQIWRSYPHNGLPAGSWGPRSCDGSPGDCHTDHVHFSFSWDGAYERTTWWTGQQHVLASTDTGRLFHAMRRTGGWTGFGDVEGQTGPLPSAAIHSAAADVGGELHVLAANGGELYHAIRRNSGWTQWGNVEGQSGEKGTVSDVAAAEVLPPVADRDSVQLHVVAATTQGGLFHAVRDRNGWTDFGNVEGQCGPLPATASQVATAGHRDELHVLAVAGGRFYHCLRTPDGWSNWGNVEGQSGDVGTVRDVDATTVGASLHVVVTTSAGGVFHTIRDATGWTAFGNVEGVAGDAGQATDVGVTGRASGQLHVLVNNTGGRLLHTLRGSSGWSDWGDVERQSGAIGVPREVNMA